MVTRNDGCAWTTCDVPHFSRSAAAGGRANRDAHAQLPVRVTLQRAGLHVMQVQHRAGAAGPQ